MDKEHELVELARLAQQGHEEARDRLARHAEAGLKAYIYRMTLNRDETEDLCQEVLAEMFVKLEELNNVGGFRAWMYKIATNVVYAYHKKRQRKAAISASVFYRSFLEDHANSKHEDGLSNLLRQELSKTVMTAMR
jgi:RNA polymerase sigma-70 factor (ECF subfamily)